MKKYILVFLLGFILNPYVTNWVHFQVSKPEAQNEMAAASQTPIHNKKEALTTLVQATSLTNTSFNQYQKNEIECLAKNVYFEARNQKLTGQLAVILVTLNRIKDKRFQKNICQNVYYKVEDRCAFSWVCQNKKIDWHSHQEIVSWNTIHSLCAKAYLKRQEMAQLDFTNGATYYHSIKVQPDWSNDPKHRRLFQLEDHIFYKWV